MEAIDEWIANFDEKNIKFFQLKFFSPIFIIKTLDPYPDPHWPTILDPYPHLKPMRIRNMPALQPLVLRHTPFYAVAAPRLKRSLPEERESLELRFSALGREFVLQLEPDHTIFHKVPVPYPGTPCGSGSVLDPDSVRSVDPDPDPGGQKCPKSIKNWRNFMFWSAGCSPLRVEGFFCNLVVLSGGLGIGKL